MPGRKTLRKVQWGLESTPGTAVAATALWRGKGALIDDARTVNEVEEEIGIFDGADRTNIPKLFATLALAQTEATFEQLQYLFAMLFGGPTTGSADGAGSSGYKYQTTFPTTSVPTGKFYTIEGGDDYEAEEVEYCHATKVNLSGVAGEAVMVSADIQGRQATRTTFTGSIAVPAVEDIMASVGALYLDAIGGTIGTTQISQQLLRFSIDFEARWEPKFTIDGQLYFSYPVLTGKRISGTITFEHDAAVGGTGSGAKALWRAQTARLMRLQFTGSSYGTAGTGTTFTAKKGLRIDLPIKFTKIGTLEDQNGNDIVTATFVSKYNATAATAGNVLIANELTALP